MDSAKRFTEAHGDNGVCETEMCTNDTGDEGGWRWRWTVWNGNMTSEWDAASESGFIDGQIKQYLVPQNTTKIWAFINSEDCINSSEQKNDRKCGFKKTFDQQCA